MQRIIQSLLSKQRNIRATGLAETVAALAILSMTMVTSIGITVKSMRLTLRTEIEDRANSIQIRAIELAKSPAEFDVEGTIGRGDKVSFSVKFDKSGKIYLEREPGTQELGDSCEVGSNYYVDFVAIDPESVDTICNQIIIKGKIAASGNLVYEIQANTVYKIFDEYYKTSMLGFRHGEIL